VAVPPALSAAASWQRWAVALVAALALFEALWEMSFAPLRPGGSWLVLKALPLAVLWLPLARGHRRARQMASLVLPLYFGEGIVRAMTESGRHAQVAAVATAIALCALIAVLLSFRAQASGRQPSDR